MKHKRMVRPAFNEPYCQLFGPHERDDGKIVYALACQHMSVSTIDVERRFSPDFGYAYLVILRVEFPDLPVRVLAMLEMRYLLGMVLSERSACRCADRPFVLKESADDVWVGDEA